MKKLISIALMIALLSPILLLSGCITMLPESQWERGRLDREGAKKYYEFNMAKTEPTGELLIHCVPPSQQVMVKNYEIQIDDSQKIKVFKYSDTRIKLDIGAHIVTVNAKGFGRSSQKDVFIEETIPTTLRYMGPYWMWSAGIIE